MRVIVRVVEKDSHRPTVVEWNDDGESCHLTTSGGFNMRMEEQSLRDLYEALDFLFGKPRS